MRWVYIIFGIISLLLGVYINSELKKDDHCISKGSVALFALIAFVIGIFVLAEIYWMMLFLLPYPIIQYYRNKKIHNEAALKVTACEFLYGTGLGVAFVFVVIWLLVDYMIKANKK